LLDGLTTTVFAALETEIGQRALDDLREWSSGERVGLALPLLHGAIEHVAQQEALRSGPQPLRSPEPPSRRSTALASEAPRACCSCSPCPCASRS